MFSENGLIFYYIWTYGLRPSIVRAGVKGSTAFRGNPRKNFAPFHLHSVSRILLLVVAEVRKLSVNVLK